MWFRELSSRLQSEEKQDSRPAVQCRGLSSDQGFLWGWNKGCRERIGARGYLGIPILIDWVNIAYQGDTSVIKHNEVWGLDTWVIGGDIPEIESKIEEFGQCGKMMSSILEMLSHIIPWEIQVKMLNMWLDSWVWRSKESVGLNT